MYMYIHITYVIVLIETRIKFLEKPKVLKISIYLIFQENKRNKKYMNLKIRYELLMK